MRNKKAISAVVALSLLLVVAVIATVSFQNWFSSYSTEIYSKTEGTGDANTLQNRIAELRNGNLYVYSGGSSNISYSQIQIGGTDCNMTGQLANGINTIDVTTCRAIPTGTYDVVVVTEDGVLSNEIVVGSASSFNSNTVTCTNASDPYHGGSGTIGDPYEICNCSQLEDMGSNLASHYELIQNIDCDVAPLNTGSGFDPIGGSFSGTLTGGNYVISGLFINRPSTNNVGLFAATLSGSNLTNFGITNVNISGATEVGALAGNSNSRVDGVYSTGRVNGSIDVGGLIGDQNELTLNSYSTARVTAISSSAGGLIGTNRENVSSSYSTGGVSGTSNVGGLIGYSNGVHYITNSYSTADVNSTSNRVGGLIGRSIGGTIVNNSYSTGFVNSTSINVGGLIGEISSGEVSNSYSTSNVNTTNSILGGLVGFVAGSVTINNSYATGSVSGVGSAGGLVGRMLGSASLVIDSYSTGNVYASGGANTGGLIGDMDEGDIESSYSTGDVESASSDVGGLVGNANAAAITINNSYSTSRVIGGATDTGGLIGELGDGHVNSSYASGNVTGTNNVGGLIGVIYYGSANSSFSTGNVSGSGGRIGGILGYLYALGNIDNSYWDNHSDNPSASIGDDNGADDVSAISDDLSHFYVSSNPPMGNWTSSIWTFSGSALPTLS